ncbi:MAG: L-serine ammonia-lyase, iron-sulfur-dependent, subunit alpha [Planctomycetota bacterium]|nr:L-serine ammonia-lyase, iron-sulfur-dependent, subunit alpha [Planctomycetota bacterium]
MKTTSIFNHVIGPVMRGPSSSHTAGAFHIGAMARSLLGAAPTTAEIAFDPAGSYAKCYREQGADLAFAAGLMGWAITDERFQRALDAAGESGLALQFAVRTLADTAHPNAVDLRLTSADGQELRARANSVGGGAVEFVRIAEWPVHFVGDAYEVAVEVERLAEAEALAILSADGAALGQPECLTHAGVSLVSVRRRLRLPEESRRRLEALRGVRHVWASEPVFFVQAGEPTFASAAEMVRRAEERGLSLGQVALEYESALLGLSRDEVLAEMLRRFDIMRQAVKHGLEREPPPMQLLAPSAGGIYDAEAAGRVAVGGLHTRAAARAMAAMHVSSGAGIVCAAPTGGSAGVLPAVLVTLAEEKGLGREGAALALLAAGAVGVVVANRATFAAEVAGCQVEIGAASAMAAAAVVEAAGGSAAEAADAAAIALQNTMGSVCDLVQGIVEIPCHTRNAVAASSAFVCADLVMGGYKNPVPLDETIDAVYAVGKMLPVELRCTARGGLAAAPSAQAMKRLR